MNSKSPEQDIGERGLREALQRLRDHLDSPGDPLVPFAEALAWAYALEEWHRQRLGGSTYFACRNASADGQVTAGVMYARGLTTHRLAIVGSLVTFPSRSFRMGGGGRRGGGVTIISGGGSVWQWRRFNELPSPSKPEQHNRDVSYQHHVQNQPLLVPLQAAERFLSMEIARHSGI